MFGLEKKKKEESAFFFDLEKSLNDGDKKMALVQLIEKRITKIKETLQKGSSKEFFNSLGILLNGYHALAIVLSRASKPQKNLGKQ